MTRVVQRRTFKLNEVHDTVKKKLLTYCSLVIYYNICTFWLRSFDRHTYDIWDIQIWKKGNIPLILLNWIKSIKQTVIFFLKRQSRNSAGIASHFEYHFLCTSFVLLFSLLNSLVACKLSEHSHTRQKFAEMEIFFSFQK